MSTIIKKPPPFIRIGHGSRSSKYHTLHFDNQVFSVQKNGTSILSFRSKGDAFRFGKLIESHYELTHQWPTIDFDDVLFFKNTKANKLKFITIKDWKDNELRDFCIEYYFNMLDIHKIENEYKLVGNSLRWDAPMSIYIELLNSRVYN
jgi:hypothetical protein